MVKLNQYRGDGAEAFRRTVRCAIGQAKRSKGFFGLVQYQFGAILDAMGLLRSRM
jgi:hypothetical protein